MATSVKFKDQAVIPMNKKVALTTMTEHYYVTEHIFKYLVDVHNGYVRDNIVYVNCNKIKNEFLLDVILEIENGTRYDTYAFNSRDMIKIISVST